MIKMNYNGLCSKIGDVKCSSTSKLWVDTSGLSLSQHVTISLSKANSLKSQEVQKYTGYILGIELALEPRISRRKIDRSKGCITSIAKKSSSEA